MDNNNMNTEQQYQYQQNQYQQPAYQQQYQYQQPAYQQYQQEELERPMSVGDWMITTLILCIPCVNFIMMFVWAFSKSTQKSKSNFFKAYLIWMAIGVGIYLIMFVIMAVLGFSMFEVLEDMM